MGKIKESETYVEVGGYVHQDAGRVKAKLYVGDVDKPLRTDDAELTKRLKKIRVSMNVSEDKSVHQNQVYEKDIEMIQEIIGEPGGKGIPQMGSSPNADGLTPLQVLKNFVDKLADNQTALWVVVVGVAILAAVALGLSIMG